VEREIGNVAADAGLKAFRYLSFAPVVFDASPVATPAVPDAVQEESALAQMDSAPSPSETPACADALLESAAPPAPPLPPEVAMTPPVAEKPLPAPPIPIAPAPAMVTQDQAGAASGMFSPTPGMPSFTTVTEAVSTPAFVIAGLAAAAPPAPVAALPVSVPPAASALSGAARLRQLAELQAGNAPRPAPPSNGNGAGRRYALLQDVRAELAGAPDGRAMAPHPARDPRP